MPSKVGIVIVNWNNPSDTIECLRDVSELAYPDYFTIVVDNGSTDDSVKKIVSAFPYIHIIQLENNLGYPGGCNAGLKYCSANGADYIFLINNDISIDKDALTHLIVIMEKNPSMGIAAPKVYFYYDKSVIFSAGGKVSLLTGQNFGIGYGEIDSAKYSQNYEVDYASGCALLVSSHLVQKIGFMDPQYFMYYDEIDYCIRAKRSGFSVWMVADAKVWHKISATVKKYSGLKEYYITKNRLIFLKKFQTRRQRIIFYAWFTLVWFPYNSITLLWSSSKLPLIKSFLYGITDGLKSTCR
jgi:GT2 family glycosyltransferase